MNVGGIPLAANGRGFFIIAGILVSMTAFLAYRALGRRNQ